MTARLAISSFFLSVSANRVSSCVYSSSSCPPLATWLLQSPDLQQLPNQPNRLLMYVITGRPMQRMTTRVRHRVYASVVGSAFGGAALETSSIQGLLRRMPSVATCGDGRGELTCHHNVRRRLRCRLLNSISSRRCGSGMKQPINQHQYVK